MKTTLLSLLLILGGAVNAQPPAGMKQYFLAFVINDKKQVPSQELTIQHLAFVRAHVASGEFSVAGHMLDKGRIFGTVIIAAPSVKGASRIMNADPMVTSGTYTAEVDPMLTGDLSCVRMELPKDPGK